MSRWLSLGLSELHATCVTHLRLVSWCQPKIPCGDDEWVPYDSNILPTENLYDKPDNLDAQPEFPLRTKFAFYKEAPGSGLVFDGESVDDGDAMTPTTASVDESTFPSATILLLLWIIGLCAWCGTFVGPTPSTQPAVGSKKRRSRKPPSEGSLSAKDA